MLFSRVVLRKVVSSMGSLRQALRSCSSSQASTATASTSRRWPTRLGATARTVNIFVRIHTGESNAKSATSASASIQIDDATNVVRRSGTSSPTTSVASNAASGFAGSCCYGLKKRMLARCGPEGEEHELQLVTGSIPKADKMLREVYMAKSAKEIEGGKRETLTKAVNTEAEEKTWMFAITLSE